MNKEQKAAQVEEIATRLSDAEAIFAIDYRGISVPQAAELRSKLAEADATFKIVKNRLAKRAAEQAGTEELGSLFEGPTALAFVKGDPVTVAKAITTFGREHGVLTYKGGLMDDAPLEPEQFTAIARLPALDVLHGQLVGVAASPLTGLARGLGSMLSGLAIGLGQIQEQGLLGEPAAEAPAEGEPAAEAEAPEAKAPAEREQGSEEEPAAEVEEPEAEAPAETEEGREGETPATEAEQGNE
jgi:large subunit ribosomal protein L10